MLQDKKILAEYLRTKCNSVVFNKGNYNKLINEIHDQYNIPTGIIADCVSGRTELENTSEFILFTILQKLDEINKTKKLPEYFTEIEIAGYSKATYKVETLNFPIVIKCLRVSDDQWIGSSDVKFLMDLREAQLINYNTNAQRTMQHVVRGNREYYKIALNKVAISEIRASLKSENYIPNTITLNIDEASNADFVYNESKSEMIINSIDHFDISDGYHRYIAMSQEFDIDHEFNYPIELRIISFSEEKVKQFIFQEDQKTKMTKIDSRSMNMNSAANILTERLNRNVMFNYKGQISRNEGKINFSEFAAVVDYYYFKNSSADISTIIKTEKEIRDYINDVTNIDESMLERDLDLKDVMIMVYCAKNSIDPNKAVEIISKKDSLDNKMFKRYRNITKRMSDAIEKLT